MKLIWWFNGMAWFTNGLAWALSAHSWFMATVCFAISVGAVWYADELDGYDFRLRRYG